MCPCYNGSKSVKTFLCRLMSSELAVWGQPASVADDEGTVSKIVEGDGMRLYLVRVTASSIQGVKFGDRVAKGQKLGLDIDQQTEVLSPADGVVRHIGLELNGQASIIHILSREDEEIRFASSSP